MLVTIKYFSKKTKLQQHERGRWLRAVTVIFWPPRRTYGQTRSNPNDVSRRHKVKRGFFLGVYTEREIRFRWIAYIRIYHRRLPELLRFPPGLFLSLHPTSPRCRNGLRDSAEIVDLSRFPRRGMAHLRLLASLFLFSHCCGAYYKENYRTKEKKKLSSGMNLNAPSDLRLDCCLHSTTVQLPSGNDPLTHSHEHNNKSNTHSTQMRV